MKVYQHLLYSIVGLCVWLASLSVCGLAAGQTQTRTAQSGAKPGERNAGSSEEHRIREGLELKDEIGEFRDTGGRVTFYPENRPITLTVLENLALERVFAEMEQRLERRSWSVSGVVTEYRGGNYLQIRRAVMRPKTVLGSETPRSRGDSGS